MLHKAMRRLLICLGFLTGATAAFPPLAETTPDGFPVPRKGWRPDFPRSHASHPEFKIEWWYITGHLMTAESGRHGFQATFFRTAHPGGAGTEDTAPDAFGRRQLFLAHMALTDTATGRFLHQERLNRSGWDASASVRTLDVVNGNWSLRALDENADGASSFELIGGIRAEASFRLRLTPAKPPVIFGEDGVSRKGAGPTAASHYITFTRLKVDGELSLDGKAPGRVTGSAWFDHEISSSQLEGGQTGWDWTSIQLEDGREVMAYILRREDGSIDPFSTLAWIDAQGNVRHHGPESFLWEPVRWWTSPDTGARYPVSIRITAPDPDAPGAQRVFLLEPFAEKQELTGAIGGVPYWEGPCRVLDASGRNIGSAYLELTGYSGDLRSVL